MLHKYSIILICSILLSCAGENTVMAGESVKDVDIIETAINFSQTEFPHVAYLYMALKNNGDKNIANLNFEISYYDADGYVIKKVVLKNKLTETIPSGETRKYKIRLKGDVFNERSEEYPYSQGNEVDDFSVKILTVKFAQKREG